MTYRYEDVPDGGVPTQPILVMVDEKNQVLSGGSSV